jgi:hypothetical protein
MLGATLCLDHGMPIAEFKVHHTDGKIRVRDCSMPELFAYVMEHHVALLRGAFPKRMLQELRNEAHAWGAGTPLTPAQTYEDHNYHAVEAGVSPRQKTLHNYHAYNFNEPDKLPADLSRKLLDVYVPLLEFQNTLTQHATFVNDGEGRRARPQLLQYPRGGGMFGRHLHALEPQRIGLVLAISERGQDFNSGGTHFDVKGEDVSSEDVHDIGDLLLFRFDIPHWIAPVDMAQPCDYSLASGRWTAVLPYR